MKYYKEKVELLEGLFIASLTKTSNKLGALELYLITNLMEDILDDLARLNDLDES